MDRRSKGSIFEKPELCLCFAVISARQEENPVETGVED